MPTTRSTAASDQTEPTNPTPGTPPPALQSPIEAEDGEGTADRQVPVPAEHEVARETTQSPGLRIRGVAAANLAQAEPTDASPSTELEEMRAWLKRTEELEELRALRELRARYEAGDLTAIQSLQKVALQTKATLAEPSSNLPRPDPPQLYQKHNRAEYNRWERDCEGYFVQSPTRFIVEARKIDFGLRYVAENLKTLWQAHLASNLRAAPLWTPTWAELKEVMLNALGTPAERRQVAYESLKRCRQRLGQSPTDLLDYMRPL